MSGYHENYSDYDYYGNDNGNNNNNEPSNAQESPYPQYADPYHDYHNTSGVGVGVGGPMVDSNGMPISLPDAMPHLDDDLDNNNNNNSNVNMNNKHDEVENNLNMSINMNGVATANNEGHGHDEDDTNGSGSDMVDFDNDPEIANLPRILMMGPRRGGKTSIQRVVFHKMSPHETLFRLEATQLMERSVVDHTPLCRFTIWDFPGDYYGPENHQQQQQQQMNYNAQQQQYGHGHGHGGHPFHNQNGLGIGAGAGGTTVGPGGGFQPHHTMNDMPQHQQQQQQMNQQQSHGMMRQPPVHNNPTNNNIQQQNQFPSYVNQFQQQQQQHNLNHLSDGYPNTITTTTATTVTTNTDDTTNNNTNNNPNQNSPSEEDEGDAYVFGRATALIFVLDAQDEPYDHVLQQFTETVKRAARANPHIAIEVFINKVDGELFLSDEAKYDCRRDVMQQVTDELADAGVMPDSVPISYHLTSIYDHSVFEAFSRVVQKLIPQLPTLENLLNVLVSTCAMEKAFLFDVASKLYISTDSSPVDMQSVELCSDMIDCVLDVSGIYGLAGGLADDDDDDGHDDDDVDGEHEKHHHHGVGGGGSGITGGRDIDSSTAPPGNELLSLNSSDPAFMKNMDGNLVDSDGGGVNAIGGGEDDFTNDIGGLDYGNDGNDELVGAIVGQSTGAMGDSEGKEKEVDADSAYDSESASVIRLSKGMVLYLKEVDTMLALVCLTRSDNFRKRNLINYNIGCLKKALRALVKTES